MAVAIAPWSVVLTPGKAEVVIPQGDLQIKNAALPDELQDQSARSTVKLTYQSLAASLDNEDDEDADDEDDDDEFKGEAVTTVLCSLTPGKIEQSSCEIILEQDMEYVLEVVGKNSIHLYGNYIDQAPVDEPPFGSDMDSDDDDDDEDEAAYNLGEVSSDVEIEIDGDEAALEDEEDDAARFEEVHDEEELPKALKRSREEDMEVDEHDDLLSKSQKKKMTKKLKTADGNAVPAPVPEKNEEEKKDKKEKKEKKEKKDKKDKKDKAEKKEKVEEKVDETKEKGDKKAPRTLEGGVKVKDHTTGTGKMAKKGDKVEVRYIGKFLDGKIFDKNTKGKGFVFKLGQGDVIKGWDIGVVGMQIGGEREIVVPPSMAYGNKKMDGIPPNSTLKFEVKLLAIK